MPATVMLCTDSIMSLTFKLFTNMNGMHVAKAFATRKSAPDERWYYSAVQIAMGVLASQVSVTLS